MGSTDSHGCSDCFGEDEWRFIRRLTLRFQRRSFHRKMEFCGGEKSESKLAMLLEQHFFHEARNCATIFETWQKRRALGSYLLLCSTNAAPLAANQLRLMLRTFGASTLKVLHEHPKRKTESTLTALARRVLLQRRQWDALEGHFALGSSPDTDFVLQIMRSMTVDPFAGNAESLLRAHRRLVLWLGAGCTLREIANYEGSHLEEIESNLELAFHHISQSDSSQNCANASSLKELESDELLQLHPQQGCFI